jgi:putative hemolysin
MTIALSILLCLMLSFLFSGMETGVLLLNRARIRHLKERGSFSARVLLDFLHRPSHLSATVLVGNTIVNGVSIILVAASFLEYKGPVAAVAAVAVFSIILGFWGDLIPKALFQRYPNRLTIHLAPILLAAYWTLWPIVQLFHLISQGVIRIIGGKVSSRQMFVTRDELKLMAREVQSGTLLSGEQRNLVTSILDSKNATAYDVMQSRPNVVTTSAAQSDDARKEICISAQVSRLPIEPTDATKKQWQGVWVAYDSLFETKTPSRNPPRIKSSANLESILSTLRKSKSPIGFVQDEEGRDIGIVTAEDVLRRFLGKLEL